VRRIYRTKDDRAGYVFDFVDNGVFRTNYRIYIAAQPGYTGRDPGNQLLQILRFPAPERSPRINPSSPLPPPVRQNQNYFSHQINTLQPLLPAAPCPVFHN